MYVIDASVWISRFSEDEVNHELSRGWLTDLLRQGEVVTEPALLLPEVAGPLARRTGDVAMAKAAMSSILRTQNVRLVEIDRELALLAANLGAELRVKGADAIYIAVSEVYGCELVTWDGTQLERGRSRLPVHKPSDLLPTRRGKR